MNPSTRLMRYSVLALAAASLTACNNGDGNGGSAPPILTVPTPAPPAPTPPAPTPPAVTPDTYVLTSGNKLVGFAAATPAATVTTALAIPAAETLLGGDFRPADGALYVVTKVTADNSLKVYTANTTTCELVSEIVLLNNGAGAGGGTAGSAITLTGSKVAVDFNPVANALRIVDSNGVNLRTTLAAGNNTFIDAAVPAGVSESAYTNSFNATCQTDLYHINTTQLLLSAAPNGVATSSAAGARFVGNLGVTADAASGFDIRTSATGTRNVLTAALKVGGSYGLYTINDQTGAATKVGDIGGLGTENVLALAANLPATAPANAPGNLFAITTDTAPNLVTFNRPPQGSAAKLCSTTAITGITAGDVIVGADTRPATGALTLLTKNGTAGALYTLSAAGAASNRLPLTVAGGAAVSLTGNNFAVDFNPVPDRLRVLGGSGQNLRINPADGVTIVDSALNSAGAAYTGTATEAAYTNSLAGGNAGSLTTTLFALDSTRNKLVRIGGDPGVAGDGTCPASTGNPNCGVVTDVADVTVNGAVLPLADATSFELNGGNGQALFVVSGATTRTLYTLNLANGVAAASGTFGSGIVALGTVGAQTATVFGVTTVGNKLVSFAPATPNTVTAIGAVGVPAGETVVGLDFRPSIGPKNGQLVAATSAGKLYEVNPATAAATLISTVTGATVPATDEFGLDFNPLPDRLRSIASTGQNLRINVDPGAATVDTATSQTGIFGAGYTNNVSSAANTTLYVLRANGSTDELARVGGDPGNGTAGDPGNPNSGVVTSIGALGFDTSNLGDLDIAGGQNGFVLAALQPTAGGVSGLYRINTATGAATKVGTGTAGDVTTAGSEPLRGLAIRLQ